MVADGSSPNAENNLHSSARSSTLVLGSTEEEECDNGTEVADVITEVDANKSEEVCTGSKAKPPSE